MVRWNVFVFWQDLRHLILETFLIVKSSVIICCTVSLFTFDSAISLTPNLWPECTRVRILSTFTSNLCVFGYLLLGSPCTSSHPSLNHLCPTNTLDLFLAYSPQGSVSRAYFSLAVLRIFVQNLMFIWCSRLLSLILLPAVYYWHVLLPMLLVNKQLIWSIVHLNASCNVSKCAWLNTAAHAVTILGIKLSQIIQFKKV
jgi:hypothetical protein